MFPDYRQAVRDIRTSRVKTLRVHRDVLHAQQESNRRQLAIARQALRLERDRALQARDEYRRVYDQARAEAHEYRIIWARAKKDGARLLQFVDRHLKRAA